MLGHANCPDSGRGLGNPANWQRPVPWFCVPGSPRVCLCRHQGTSRRPLAAARTRWVQNRIAPLLLGDNMGLRRRPINGGMVPAGPGRIRTHPFGIGRIRLAFPYQWCPSAPRNSAKAGCAEARTSGACYPLDRPETTGRNATSERAEAAARVAAWIRFGNAGIPSGRFLSATGGTVGRSGATCVRRGPPLASIRTGLRSPRPDVSPLVP